MPAASSPAAAHCSMRSRSARTCVAATASMLYGQSWLGRERRKGDGVDARCGVKTSEEGARRRHEVRHENIRGAGALRNTVTSHQLDLQPVSGRCSPHPMPCSPDAPVLAPCSQHSAAGIHFAALRHPGVALRKYRAGDDAHIPVRPGSKQIRLLLGLSGTGSQQRCQGQDSAQRQATSTIRHPVHPATCHKQEHIIKITMCADSHVGYGGASLGSGPAPREIPPHGPDTTTCPGAHKAHNAINPPRRIINAMRQRVYPGGRSPVGAMCPCPRL